MANNLLSVWGTVGSVLLAILILLVMVTIHEFGHYIAGKIFHFKIDEFSVGFGPALFKHKSKKTGELFALRIIPLGGYCAFAGEDGLEEEEKKDENKEEPFSDLSTPPVTSAEQNQGSSAQGNATVPTSAQGNTISSTQGNTSVSSSASGEDTTSCPPPASGKDNVSCPPLASGKDNVSCPPPASGGGVGEGGRPQTERPDTSGYFTRRPCWQRIIVLISGALMNYLLALFLIIVGFLSYGQTMVAVYKTEEAEGEFAAYSLQDLDIFLQIEGKDLYLTSDIAQALNGKKRGDLVKMRVSRAFGVEWKEEEEGERPTFDHREEMEISVMLRSDVTVKNSADFTSVWDALGVKYEHREDKSDGYFLANAIYKFGFGEALGRAFVYSFKIAGSIFKVIGELLTGKLGLSAFGGPVTTIRMTSEIASRGFRYFLEIAGYIGVNLAVFNLLPIPALDGSKVVFTAIEWVRGKPISRKVEAIIHAVGFILLLGFAVLVDILQFVL